MSLARPRVSDAYRDVLRVRDARALIGASGASQLGDWLYNAALLGYVYSATGSAGWVGAATICRLLPYVLLSPLGGIVADRYDARLVLMAGDVLRCLHMLVLAAVVATDGPVILVIALTAMASAAGTAERPAAMALLPRLVGESRLGPANALLHTVQDLGIVVGPAIGAVLLVVGSAAVAFLVNGLTFAVSAALVSTMSRRVTTTSSRESLGSQVSHGLRVSRATPFVIPLFLVVAMVEFTYGAQTVQLVLYAEQKLGLGAEGYGYLLAAAGVGGLLSALVNARLATSTKVSGIVVATGVLFCATQLAYAWVDVVAVALIVTLAGGVGVVACEVVAETALARVVPSEALGRVMGVFEALSVAAMIAGAVFAPLLVHWTSLRTSLAILGLAAVVTILVCRAVLAGLDAVSRARAEFLASRVAVIERLPIAVGAPRVVLEQLAAASQICPLPTGVDVVVEGAPAHAFYAVIDGSVVVHRNGEELAHLGAGDYFGERGLLDNAPRNATVTTEQQSTVLAPRGQRSARSAAVRADDAVSDRSRQYDGAHGLVSTRARRSRRRPELGGSMSVDGKTVVVVSAGYIGKRRALSRMAELGARLVVVDEPGHWSEVLVAEGVAHAWLAAPVVGDADADAAAVLGALEAADIRPEGVLTFWEDSVCVVARVAAALGLPGNPPEAVDAARSKVRTRELSAELGLPTPKAQRVQSLDELFAAASYVGFPAVVKPEFGASAVGCVRVENLESLPGVYTLVRSVVTPETDAIFRAGNDLAPGGVPRRCRVRCRSGDGERKVRVLERLAELADGRAVVPGDGTSLPTRPRPQGGSSPRRLRRPDRAGIRAASRRPARGGKMHESRPAHHRGERADGWGKDPPGCRGGLGSRPHRGAPAQRPGSPGYRQAESPAAVRCRRCDRVRTRGGSPGRPFLRRGRARRLPGSRDRCPRRDRGRGGRPGSGLRDRSG